MQTDVWTYQDKSKLGFDPMSGKDLPATTSRRSTARSARSMPRDDDTESYLIVDTGPWIFGKKVMLPAGVVRVSTRPTRRSG